ncbi:hypothetical protein H4Q26_003967 [Puccinia striiformis f. sp. tritici PST-130]|nr:hypothetical protein H4Q26_003967 [Puccinia striiformis f. sp. tritici PST-130]
MTLRGHSEAILALDFSSPYGYLVSSSLDESVQLWDLATGESIRTLKGHNGMVKCLQVEDMTCITGGVDGQIGCGTSIEPSSSIPKTPLTRMKKSSKIAFRVTGSSDKTIRQWDLNTGQAVMTMDILWAIQNPPIPTPKVSSRRQFRNPSSSISDFEFGTSSQVPSASNWSDRSRRPTPASSYTAGDDLVESL